MNKSDGSIVIDTRLDNSGFEAGSKRTMSAIQSFIKRVNGLKDAFSFGRVLDKSFQGMAASAETARANLDSVSNEAREGLGSIDDYINAVEKFAETCASFDEATSIEEAERVISDLTDQVERFGNTEFDIDGMRISGSVTPQFQQMAEAVQLLQRQLQTAVHGPEWVAFQDRWQGMATMSGIVKSAFMNTFQAITSSVKTAGTAISTVLQHPLQTADRALGALGQSAGRAVSSLFKMTTGGIVSGIVKIGEAAKNAAVHLAKMAAGAIRSGLQKVGEKIKNIGKSSKQAGSSLSMSLKQLLLFSAGFQALQTIIRKIPGILQSAYEEFAKSDTAFGQTINNFKSALETLKYSFAAAFAPIVETVLPILTSLINGLSAAISKIGQLVAALTGRTTYKKAIVNQANLASNTDSATDAMQDETKAAKEAQKTLAGFDDVEILRDNKQDSTSQKPAAGNGAAGLEELPIENQFKSLADALKDMWKMADFTELGRMLGQGLKNALDMIPWDYIKSVAAKLGKSIATLFNGFLEVPGLLTTIGKTIGEGINTIFEFLDAFASNFHWSSLGQAIKDGILGMLSVIDWPLIYHTMATFGEGIGTALETALNNPEIWTGVFTAISNVLNSIVYGMDAFLKAVDWASLGANIGTGLNSGVEAFDWNALSQTLIDLINGAFDLWYNFVTTFDFKKFGSHIGTALSTAIKGINWTEGGASVAETIEGLFNALNGFMENTDWKALGAAVIDAIGGFFNEFDWSTVTEFLSNCITGLYGALAGAIEEIDWKELPGKIFAAFEEWVEGVDFSGIAATVGELIGAAFTALIEVGGELWETLKGVGKNIMEGGFQGIKDALASVGEWIKTNIFDPFITGFKTAFGIESPSTEMMPLGGYIIEGMLKGIIDGLATIGTWIKTNIVDPFVSGVKSMFGLDGEESVLVSVGKDLIAGLKAGIGSVMTGISDWIKTVITDPFVSGVKSMFGLDGEESVLVSVGKNLLEGLKSGLLGAMDGIGDWIDTNVTGPICGFFKSLFGIASPSTVFSEYGGFLLAGLKNGLLAAMDGIGDWIGTNVTGPICGFFKDLFGIASPSTVFSEYGGYLMEGLEGGIDDNKELPKTALTNAQTSMENVFSAQKQLLSWAKVGSNVMTIGLRAGILLKTPAVLATVTKLEDDMRKVITKQFNTWKTAAGNLLDNFKQGLSGKQSTLVTTVNTIITALKTKIDSFKSQLNNSGRDLMTELQNGMNGMSSSISSSASNIATGIHNSFNNQNWNNLGYNIGMGIYNGLVSSGSWLSTLAWNTAVDMYNSACRALGIASPSKEFAWIGEMITKGLGGGIEATQDNAVNAVTSLADAVTQEAEDSSPIMQIDTAVNGIDGVLSTFSDKVVQSFDAMISAMEDIVNGSSLTLPAMANGSVMPYSARRSASQDEENRLSSLLETMAMRDSDRLTRDDLTEVFTNLFRQYLDINFYIGDEQIARHANTGNMKLNRRYSTT